MGVSTDGIICLGIPYEESVEFPWADEDGCCGQDELETWWEETGSKNKPPVQIVNYCSGGCPMYILAVPGSVQEGGRGYPIEIFPAKIDYNIAHSKERLEYMFFMNEHVLSKEDMDQFSLEYGKELTIQEPVWLLASYWDQ